MIELTTSVKEKMGSIMNLISWIHNFYEKKYIFNILSKYLIIFVLKVPRHDNLAMLESMQCIGAEFLYP